jgi:hypothetical protein
MNESKERLLALETIMQCYSNKCMSLWETDDLFFTLCNADTLPVQIHYITY